MLHVILCTFDYVVKFLTDALHFQTLEAAQKRHDAIVCHRMLSCPDLFAFYAKYHRSCHTHFISTTNIFAAQKRHLAEANVNIYDEATKVVFQQLHNSVF